MTRARIYYARVDELWRREEKYTYLEEKRHVGGGEWQELQPDAKNNWLTEGMADEFQTFAPLGTKETKAAQTANVEAIFKIYTLGVSTNRDDVVYDFDKDRLSERIKSVAELFNSEVLRYRQKGKPKDIDSFLSYDKIKWSEHLKAELKAGSTVEFDELKIRSAIYRPFVNKVLYYDDVLNDRPGLFRTIFQTFSEKTENLALCVSDKGWRAAFSTLAVNTLPDLHLCASSDAFQCFPFYTYDEDGTNRRENVTDWALEKFRAQYGDPSISKWDIFHYVYALLHHPLYRERYAANLKRELPRLPFAPDFRAFADAGAQFAELHVNYESQPEYPLERVEQPGAALDWRVERMKLAKDRRSLVYNDFLTLSGIPPETFEYRLGNRSALEWVVDQYRATTDQRSGITNDPNRADDPQYIVRLVGQVVRVSVETVSIVRALPGLGLDPAT